jgi:hypothetical protein
VVLFLYKFVKYYTSSNENSLVRKKGENKRGGWGWKKNTRGQFKQVLSEEKRELLESAK